MSLIGAISLTDKEGVFLGSVNIDNLNLEPNQIVYSNDGVNLDGSNNLQFDGTSKLHIGETLGFTNTYQTNLECITNSNQSTQNIILQNKNTGSTASTNLYLTNDGTVSQDANYCVIGMNGNNYAGSNYITDGKNQMYIANTNDDLNLAVNFVGSGAGIHLTGNGGTSAISVNANNAISVNTTYNATTDTHTYECGNPGQVLTSQGASAHPTWETPSSSGGVSITNQSNTQITYCTNTSNVITSNSNFTFNEATNTLSTSNLSVSLVNGEVPLTATSQAQYRLVSAGASIGQLHCNQDITWEGNNLNLFANSATGNIVVGHGKVNTIDSNLTIGNKGLNSITTGAFNTCIGYNAGASYTNHSNNTIVGYQLATLSGATATSNGCTLIGSSLQMQANTTLNATILGFNNRNCGGSSLVIGNNCRGGALTNMITIGSNSGNASQGQDSICIGSFNRTSNTSVLAYGDICIGNYSMSGSSSGYNLGIGSYSCLNATTGARNIALGSSAGAQTTSINDCIFIGSNACATGTLASCSNITVIGSYSSPSATSGISNEMTLGNASLATLRAPGIGFINTANRQKTTGHYAGSAPLTITGDTVIAESTYWLINNKSGSDCVLTLPSASTYIGRILYILNYQTSFQVVSGSSDVIPIGGGSAQTVIIPSITGKWATLVSDGTNWLVMQNG